MSYFNHAFKKVFPGTLPSGTYAGVVTSDGLVTTAGVPTSALRGVADAGPGGLPYGFFNKNSYLSVNLASTEVTTGQPLILAGSSVKVNDKQGPFHGGYAESNKSKYINPKFIHNFYKMCDAVPEQSVVHVGVTNFQSGTSLSILTPGIGCAANGVYTNVPTTGGAGSGFTVDIEILGGVVVSVVENQVGTGYIATDVITLDTTFDPALDCAVDPEFTIESYGTQTCEFEFLCGESYNLFINLYGAPVLRVLNHDAYRTLEAYTGCCPSDAIEPVAVDSTLVFIDWANQIIESPYLKEFIRPIVFTETGIPYFATAAEAVAAGWPATQVWTNYVSTGHIAGALGGIRLVGAYIDTIFQTCSFQVSDFFNKEIVQMDVSLTDEDGNPCKFKGLCVETECCGFGGQGFGDTYLKELILAESYLQNTFSTDPRIREITQGNDLRDALDRTLFYTKYVLQHSVPRYNNPTAVFDNDQYDLVIYVPSGTIATALELFVATWINNAGNPLGSELLAEIALTGEISNSFCRVPCIISPLPLPTLPSPVPLVCTMSLLSGGVQTPCDPATNEYTQEVTVTYLNAPLTGTLVVNSQTFAITTSPQTVTLIGLDSDGEPVNVNANFSDSVLCALEVEALFTAPASCD